MQYTLFFLWETEFLKSQCSNRAKNKKLAKKLQCSVNRSIFSITPISIYILNCSINFSFESIKTISRMRKSYIVFEYKLILNQNQRIRPYKVEWKILTKIFRKKLFKKLSTQIQNLLRNSSADTQNVVSYNKKNV